MLTDSVIAPTSSLRSMRTRWSTPSFDVRQGERLEAGHLAHDRIGAGRQRRRGVFAAGVGDDGSGERRALVEDRDLGARDDGAGRIRDRSENGAADGLCECGRGRSRDHQQRTATEAAVPNCRHASYIFSSEMIRWLTGGPRCSSERSRLARPVPGPRQWSGCCRFRHDISFMRTS